jgi:hypothetical protein
LSGSAAVGTPRRAAGLIPSWLIAPQALDVSAAWADAAHPLVGLHQSYSMAAFNIHDVM